MIAHCDDILVYTLGDKKDHMQVLGGVVKLLNAVQASLRLSK